MNRPTRPAASALIDPRLASATVLSPEGSPVRLDSLWATGPAVIAWIRHYG
jgi:hypothetical protein